MNFDKECKSDFFVAGEGGGGGGEGVCVETKAVRQKMFK